MKKAILFGLNYKGTKAQLNGCINDVHNMKELLQSQSFDVVVHTDEDIVKRTNACDILQELNNMAIMTHQESIEHVWIHYSGHGCGVRDLNGDERDGKDECLVPSDYATHGLVKDDHIKNILRNFNKNTKVTLVVDCCHSGTIADLKYRYVHGQKYIESSTVCPAKIVCISGCKDNQTSADAYHIFNEDGVSHAFTGALTSCILHVLKESTTIPLHALVENVRKLLASKHFSQYPQITSSFEIQSDTTLF